MFIGHIAVGLAARRSVPRVLSGHLDDARPISARSASGRICLLAGLEHVRIAPWDHGIHAARLLRLSDHPQSRRRTRVAVRWSIVLMPSLRHELGSRAACWSGGADPLDPRCRDAPARHAGPSARTVCRAGIVELDPGDAVRGAGDVRRRPGTLRHRAPTRRRPASLWLSHRASCSWCTSPQRSRPPPPNAARARAGQRLTAWLLSPVGMVGRSELIGCRLSNLD